MGLKFGKLLLAGIVISGCLLSAQFVRGAQAKDAPPYNIILLTPDQLRADFMHTYGYPYPDTPDIDQLASQGTVFTRAYAAVPWTTPSFAAILTSLFPTVHGMTLPPYESCGPSITRPLTSGSIPSVPPFLLLSPHKPIIPDLLKAHGMVTAADNANCWSIWDVVHRGWDHFKFFPGYQLPVPGHPGASSFYLTAPKTTAWAEQWLKEHRGQRFFFWVHYMEPHAPYNAPAAYDRFKTPDDFPNLNDTSGEGPAKLQRLAKVRDVHAIRRLRELYAAKILYVDHYIGELLNTVHTLGLDKNTIIILVSDHGQLLYSHPKDFNTDDHRSLYDADLHVPLIFRGPGIPAGKRLDDLVSHYDILPTILDLENLPPPARTDGASLKGVIEGTSSEPPHHYLYAEESVLTPQYSIRNVRYKLIETMRTGKIQCFDGATDPRELRNICGQIPEEAAELKAALDQHIQSLIRQAKSYPDWRNNIGLAVLEQRDSKSLDALAPRRLTVAPSGGVDYQLTGRAWELGGQGHPGPLVYWAPPGPGNTYILWRSDTPLTGEYEISVRYQGAGIPGIKQADHANYVVRFKGGSLSFPIDQTQQQGEWHLLGRFYDPVSVELSNRADGAVVAGSVRFVRLQNQEASGAPQ